MPVIRNRNVEMSKDGGKTVPVPLCHGECNNPIGQINQMLNSWLRVNAELRNRVTTTPMSETNGRVGSKVQPPRITPDDLLRRGMSNLKCKQSKRISPEFPNVVSTYTPPKKCSWSQQQMDVVSDPMQQSTPTHNRLFENQLDPKVKVYPSAAMQPSRNAQNYVCGGNEFYKNQKMQLPSARSVFEYLDPKNVEYLLKCVKVDLTMRDSDAEYLAHFLRTAAKLTPIQFTTYFAILRARGAISLDVLRYLTTLLGRLNFELHPVQMNMLLNAFNIMAEASIRSELMGSSFNDKNEIVKMKEEIITLRNMADPGDMPRRNEYFRAAFSVPTRVGKNVGTVILTADFPPFRGVRASGQHEPWDYVLPWDGYQRFFQQVLVHRMVHFNMENYPYTSRLQRYYAEWGRRQQSEWSELQSAQQVAMQQRERFERQASVGTDSNNFDKRPSPGRQKGKKKSKKPKKKPEWRF